MRRFLLWSSSLRTGILLLILVGVAAAAGTFVLQRPMTEPEQMARVYSPGTLRILDGIGLTDVFHSWWFALLLAMLGVNIVLASIDRFPVAWRYISRPHERPAEHFLNHLPVQKEILIRDAGSGIEAAERGFRRLGLRPRRVGHEEVSLFAEQNRFARLAAYGVHLSLLLIFGGGIADTLVGYRGFVALEKNQQSSHIELRNGTSKAIPFALRCDGAGQENYADGTPRRWWSDLVVVEEGREVRRKTIEVNKPLEYRGLRFYQSSYRSTGRPVAVRLAAARDDGKSAEIILRPGETASLDEKASVRLVGFNLDDPNHPNVRVEVRSGGRPEDVWLSTNSAGRLSPYIFNLRDVEFGYFTGLQVTYEPGQWAVWAGCTLLAMGLACAFYFVPMRFWAVPVSDGRGRLALWLGASATKNRDDLEIRFHLLAEEIEKEIRAPEVVRGEPCRV